MEHTINTVADRLYSKLPDDLEFIDPQWLDGFGIPPFIAARIRHLLLEKLQQALVYPDTIWADLHAKPVRTNWSRFVETAETETRLPYSEARDVLGKAVGEITGIIIEPRKNLPDFLFGSDQTLNFSQASERVSRIVVYPHFGQQLPNYMRRKQLDYIDRERYALFISQLDDKLTASYSPLNWIQLLAPLFELMEDRVDAGLFAAFFRDKNREDIAARFDDVSDTVSSASMKELLAGPAKSKQEVQHPDTAPPSAAPAIKPETIKTDTPKSETVSKKAEPVPVTPRFKDETAEPQNVSKPEPVQWSMGTEEPEETDDPPAQEPSLADAYMISSATSEKPKEPAAESATKSTADKPKENDDPGASAEDEPDLLSGTPVIDSDGIPLVERFRVTEPEPEIVADQASDEPTESEQISDDVAERVSEAADELPVSKSNDGATADLENTDESVPMWKRFISAAASVTVGKSKASPDAEQEKPLAEKLTAPEDDYELDIDYINPLRVDEIRKTLDNKKKYYIKRFFKGDQAAFNTVVRDLSAMDNWKEAGPYVTKNVFRKYKIDPLSDDAVDFVDRLQSYFTSNQS